MNDEQWVNRRMQSVEPAAGWHPDATAALAGVRRREARRHGWMWSLAAAATCVVAMLAMPAPAKCALAGVGCKGIAPAVAASTAAHDVANYKVQGSPTAPVTLEIFSDYECPACGYFYTTVFPQFEDEFVKTGKVRVVHRDFPLPQHQYARLAARYANAAGELGHYDQVFTQLFRHQNEWAENGNVDAVVAQVLSPATMQQVRDLIAKDPKVDDSVNSDLALVQKEGIHQTPTLVFVYKGERKVVNGPPSLTILKSYIDELMGK